MAQAKVATSAKMAIDYGILKPTDGITTNRDFLIHDAKNVVLGMAKAGYKQPRPMKNIPVGGEDTAAAFRVYVQGMYNAGYVTDYDRHVAAKLGHVVTGGQVRMGLHVHNKGDLAI
jgi:3-hydroxyacyl-CoA dehydrogenase